MIVQSRLWFNEANDSSYFLVPGLVVLVMTLIGGLLTAMVMAREWERGTLESLFVTPVRSDEILLGKTLPYFVLALFGFVLCVLSAKFLFHVPLRGSMWVLLGASMLYVLIALGIGLLISSWVKNQLVASQLTMLVTFLPAFMLSGFLFDLRSMPTCGANDHLCSAGALLRGAAAERVSGRRRLVGDRPEHPGARGDGGCAGSRQPRRHAQGSAMNTMLGALLRILALTRKELLAVLKDRRSRMSLLIPPVVQALIFGYAATYDLNHVTYAALDQDHSAASRQLLAGLDGSGVFERVADLQRASDVKSLIDARRALLIVQIDQQFERHLLSGQSADVQLIADGRNSNTAGTAIGYVGSIVDQFNANWGHDHGIAPPPRAARRARLVQPESRDALVHDSRHDRHIDAAPDADAHGDVGRARARAGHFRSAAGDAVSTLRDHGRQGAAFHGGGYRSRPAAYCWSPSCGSEFPLPDPI